MSKVERLYHLHNLLSQRRTPISRHDLMDRLECSQATLYRLVAELRDYLGAPLEQDEENRGFYYDRSYEQPFCRQRASGRRRAGTRAPGGPQNQGRGFRSPNRETGETARLICGRGLWPRFKTEIFPRLSRVFLPGTRSSHPWALGNSCPDELRSRIRNTPAQLESLRCRS